MKRADEVPKMDAETLARFNKDARALFRARWSSHEVADWAMGAASGFGKYWRSKDHAREAAATIVRAINAEQRAAWREVTAELRNDPLLNDLVKLVGGKLKL